MLQEEKKGKKNEEEQNIPLTTERELRDKLELQLQKEKTFVKRLQRRERDRAREPKRANK